MTWCHPGLVPRGNPCNPTLHVLSLRLQGCTSPIAFYLLKQKKKLV